MVIFPVPTFVHVMHGIAIVEKNFCSEVEYPILNFPNVMNRRFLEHNMSDLNHTITWSCEKFADI